MTPEGDIAELVERLNEEATRLSSHSLDRGSAEAGIASNLASEAADALEQARNEALEEAAKVADRHTTIYLDAARTIAAAIRALKGGGE